MGKPPTHQIDFWRWVWYICFMKNFNSWLKTEHFDSWKDLFEMASFSLPHPIQIGGKEYSLIDMQFELEPRTLDINGHVMNQGSKFVAKIPEGSNYLVYNGEGYSDVVSAQEAMDLQELGYKRIPDNWFRKARFIE